MGRKEEWRRKRKRRGERYANKRGWRQYVGQRYKIRERGKKKKWAYGDEDEATQ